ncbi:MAG: LysR family transcriptional regulator [Cognatishimia sp.]
MDHLGYLESFLAVLDRGSLSGAARAQGISQPAISQQMSALEAVYGTPLLQRSTTGATATRAGSIVARHATEMLKTHRQMQGEIAALADTPRGELRVTLSQFMATNPVGEKLQALHGAYPDLKLMIKVEDRLVDVVKEGYDLALRTGDLGTTDGIIRKIARMDTVLVATPAYLDQAGRPKHHSEMGQHAYIQYAEHKSHGYLTVTKNGTEAEAELVAKVVVDTPVHLTNALMSGLGFGRMPLMFVSDLLAQGKLELVLPDYEVEQKPIYLIYPHRHALTQSSRVVIQAIYEGLRHFEGVHLITHQDLSQAA